MNISHENRLLLYCAQTRMPEDALNKVKDIISLSLNWEEVLASAFWHGIAPLLYNNLKDIQESYLIPREIMDQMRTAYHGNLARNMYLYAELKRILETFCDKGVKVIVLKGAALAKTVYGDIGLRPMGDIDLLVKREDLPHAENIMSGLGYNFQGNMSPDWYRENHQHISYVHSEKNIPVEIHWHIANKSHPFRIRNLGTDIIERWWERAQNIEVSGSKTLMLCPEDLILHLCLHFIKHRFLSQNKNFNGGFSSRGALIQMCDIFQTLKHYRDAIHWVRLKHEAEKYGIDNLIYTTLFIVREIMGEYDEVFHNALSRFRSEDLDKELIQLINKRILIRENILPAFPGDFMKSPVADTFQMKVRILLKEIFPHPKVLSKRYSVPLSSQRLYLYYFIRPFRLLLKYCKIIREIPRIKEDVILNTWINSQDNISKNRDNKDRK
jgi:hypothetical protein